MEKLSKAEKDKKRFLWKQKHPNAHAKKMRYCEICQDYYLQGPNKHVHTNSAQRTPSAKSKVTGKRKRPFSGEKVVPPTKRISTFLGPSSLK